MGKKHLFRSFALIRARPTRWRHLGNGFGRGFILDLGIAAGIAAAADQHAYGEG
jgi:hypothetical protein